MTEHLCFSNETAGKWPVEYFRSAACQRWRRFAALLLAVGGLSLPLRPAAAQSDVFWTGATGNYNTGSNWDIGFPPDGDPLFMESGEINNGGIAQLSSLVFAAPVNLRLGDGADSVGTLEILSGGEMETLTNLLVGVGGGEGHLIMRPGASLTVSGALNSLGAASSSVLLDGSGAAMTATVSGQAQLGRNTRVIGPNVDFTAGSLLLGSASVLTAEITGATHSALKANGGATLGGTLNLDFNGVTPSPGDSWQIVDAGSVTGSFSSVNSNVPVTEPGFAFFVETVAGGMNGRVAQVSVEARLMLSVDRGTGAASLHNLTTSETYDIDGYLITSAGSRLAPAGWNSFQGAGQADWEEANPTANSLSEINLAGSRMIGPSSSVNLGNILAPATQLGSPEDLVFQYNVPGAGPQAGIIEYSGPQNNLVLIVDPVTGEAALQNQSLFDIDLDAYEITSNSASLDPAGWDSLSDGGMAGWEEANPTGNAITELNLDASTLMSGRSSAINLGTIFDTSAEQDLVLHYNIAGIGPMLGIVDYGEIPEMMMGIPGDYNGNGQVEQGDLDLVLLNWGQPGVPGGWVNDLPNGNIDQAELDGVLLNWGNMAAAGLAASGVPEPSTIAILLVAAAMGSGLIRKR